MKDDLAVVLPTFGAATIWLRAAASDWPSYYLAEPLMDYHVHPGQVSTRSSEATKEVARLERFSFSHRELHVRRARGSRRPTSMFKENPSGAPRVQRHGGDFC